MIYCCIIATTTKWDHVSLFLESKKNFWFVYICLHSSSDSSTLVYIRLHSSETGLHSSTLVEWLVYVFRIDQTDVLKTCQKIKFLGKKIWRNALALKSKTVQGIFGKRLFWHYFLQLSFFYKSVSQNFLNLFCSGDKRILSQFLGK